MKKTLPLYKITVNEDDELGVFATSIVDAPAVQSNFLTFKEEQQRFSFEIQNEEEHKLLGCVIRADYPIYRRTQDNYEYAVVFDADVIEKLAKKMMKTGSVNVFGLDHTSYTDNNEVEVIELFIKDSSKGISPKGFEDIEEGSLFAVAKVNSEEIWKSIKNGERNGFSIEIVAEIEPEGMVDLDFNRQNKVSKIDRINSLIKEIYYK